MSALTAILWFFGGMDLALVGILTGLSAEKSERGKTFGFLALANGIGSLISGLTNGTMVDHWGYPVMFLIMAAATALVPLSACFLTEIRAKSTDEKPGSAPTVRLGRSFSSVFSATLLASIPGFIVLLVRSLRMNDLGFSATAIRSNGAIGSVVTLPVPFLIGWLSDRKGRKIFLSAGYLVAAVSAALLGFSIQMWHFWAFAFLQPMSSSVTGPVGNALATDVLPPQALGKWGTL